MRIGLRNELSDRRRGRSTPEGRRGFLARVQSLGDDELVDSPKLHLQILVELLINQLVCKPA